jgi:hypothetical protein
MQIKRQIKRLGSTPTSIASTITAHVIIWGILIPLVAAGVIATWRLLLGLING